MSLYLSKKKKKKSQNWKKSGQSSNGKCVSHWCCQPAPMMPCRLYLVLQVSWPEHREEHKEVLPGHSETPECYLGTLTGQKDYWDWMLTVSLQESNNKRQRLNNNNFLRFHNHQFATKPKSNTGTSKYVNYHFGTWSQMNAPGFPRNYYSKMNTMKGSVTSLWNHKRKTPQDPCLQRAPTLKSPQEQ